MELLIILVISIALLWSLYNNSRLQKLNGKLQKENSKLKNDLEESEEEAEEILSIDPGDKAIIPDYGLAYREQNKKSFKVTYEVEIIEVSSQRVKVNAIDFTTSDAVAKDPNNRNGIINFMQNKWVNRSEIELLIDDSVRRDAKLRKIGIV
jgi:hypothetical protein